MYLTHLQYEVVTFACWLLGLASGIGVGWAWWG